MFWVVLSGSKLHPEKIWGDTILMNHNPGTQMKVYDRIEDARERKAYIEKKWGHLKAWVVELGYE